MLPFIFNLICLPIPAGAPDVRSMGCMTHRTLVKAKIESDDFTSGNVVMGAFAKRDYKFSGMTVHVCVTRCWREKFIFAAMQNGTRCFCGSELTALTGVSDVICNKRCIGNCNQRCGGAVAISVYDTGYEQETDSIVDPSEFKEVGWRGCHQKPEEDDLCLTDLGWHRVPEVFSGRMQPQLCVAYCTAINVDYAILTSIDSCCCDWQFGKPEKYKPVETYHCNNECDGDPQIMCAGLLGGIYYVTVYSAKDLMTYKTKFPKFTKEQLNSSGFFAPVFPEYENFHAKELTPDVFRYLGKPYTGPVVDNEAAVVINVPESEMSTEMKILIIVLGIVGSLGLIAIFYFFYQWHKGSLNLNPVPLLDRLFEEGDKRYQKKQKRIRQKRRKRQRKQGTKKNKHEEWNAVPSGSETDVSSKTVP